MTRKPASDVRIIIEQGNALAIKADVLALKYANALYGVDRAVVGALVTVVPGIEDCLPKPDGSTSRRQWAPLRHAKFYSSESGLFVSSDTAKSALLAERCSKLLPPRRLVRATSR